MRAQEFVNEKWSEKYKRSINCSNPKGFSQRAHCQGRKKNEDLAEFAPSNGYNLPDIKARYQHGQDFVVSVNGDQYSFAVTNMEAQGKNPVLFNIANHIMMDVNGDQPPRDIQQAVANYIDEYHQRDLAKVSAFHDKKYAQHPDYYHTTYQKPLQRVSNFVKKDPKLDEEQLDELQFKGSECTKDCSGHMAGYDWSIRKAGKVPNSHSPSFNKGAAIQRAGL